MTNLDDICLLRMNELSCILAGCASIDPVGVFPLLSKLERGDITDQQARKYLISIRAHIPEFKAADDAGRSTLCVAIASKLGLLPDYARWLNLVDGNSIEMAKQSIEEIQDLKTTAKTLIALKPFILEVEEASEWR